jgi:hypothetical protein
LILKQINCGQDDEIPAFNLLEKYKEAFWGHLYYDAQIQRHELIKEKLLNIINGN